ncbi:MAG: hypothetical protein ACLU9S_22715 [Oscillospiraceae bacterium]
MGAWNLSNMFSAIAPGITYAGHDDSTTGFTSICPPAADQLYALIGVEPSGTVYELSLLKILSTDSKYAISGQHMNQSLYYDGNTGWIYWARYDGESSSSLVAIHEETGEVVAREPCKMMPAAAGGSGTRARACPGSKTGRGGFLWSPAMQVAQTDIAFEVL